MMRILRRALQSLFLLLCHPVSVALCSVAGVLLVRSAENGWLSVPFSLAVVAVISALAFLASDRPAFSIYLGWMTVGVLTVVSATKYRLKGFSFHFYDAVFVAGDPEIYSFLFSSYLHLILPVFALLGLILAFAIGLYRADSKANYALSTRSAVLAVFAAAIPLTFPAEASAERQFYYLQGRHLSAFFVSLIDLKNLFVQPAFEARLEAMAPQAPFPDTVDCGDRTQLPDVFFVLSESQSDPAYFSQIEQGVGFAEKFAPAAGRPHPMTVETFGGGTWITNLSLMTGLSSTDFGWRSPYLTITLEGRVGGALPEVLGACGYHTAVLLPMNETFVNEGPFLKSIGFETVLDIADIAAPSYHLRDDFYYRAAETFIAEHRRTDGRPLFLEIQTMFPHSPYNDRLEPQLKVDGEPFSPDFDISEYLRRMAIARGDFQAFLEKRAAQSAEHASVIFEFGDHQSSATKPLVDALAGDGALSEPGSLAYRTFYTLTTFNHPLAHPIPEAETLDIGFVGASLLDAAGLPMSPMMTDLIALRDLCHGAFHSCPDRQAVDVHLRRRVDSGLLHLFPTAPPLHVAATGR